VVRSGQEVWLWDFNRTDQQRGHWEARQEVIRVEPECASGRHWRHGMWLISLSDGLYRGVEHRFREHGERHEARAGF
jgi:hypothetical protein